MSTTAETLRIAKNENLAALKRVASVLWRLLKIVPWRKVAKFTAGIITGLCIAAVQFIGLLAHAAVEMEENETSKATYELPLWFDDAFNIVDYDTGGPRAN